MSSPFDSSAHPRSADGKFTPTVGSPAEVELEAEAEWPFDEDDIDVYTSGECYRLARQLEQLGAGTLVVIRPPGSDTAWNHMLVQLPDERYLDIEGIHTHAEIVAYWDGDVREVTDYESEIEGQGQGAYTDEDARETAEKLWAHIGAVQALTAPSEPKT